MSWMQLAVSVLACEKRAVAASFSFSSASVSHVLKGMGERERQPAAPKIKKGSTHSQTDREMVGENEQNTTTNRQRSEQRDN